MSARCLKHVKVCGILGVSCQAECINSSLLIMRSHPHPHPRPVCSRTRWDKPDCSFFENSKMPYSVVSLNQPTLCPNATWSTNGTTFANSSTVNSYPYALFVDTNNAVYVAETSSNRVQVWPQGSVAPTRTLSGLNAPHALCVTGNGNVYVDNGNSGNVLMWTLNATSGAEVMIVPGRCMGLYVDTNHTLYCSMDCCQKVIAISLNSGSTNATITVAGTGTIGSAANLLKYPNGIVVDLNFTLYVADWGNNRVQRFWQGQLNATTVAGTGATGTLSLNGPTGVMVDSNGYLYIADFSNARIVGQGPYGFRCVVGCSGLSGSSPSQLYEPQNLGFDSYGNIYVADSGNNRIQKFLLTNNTCTTSG